MIVRRKQETMSCEFFLTLMRFERTSYPNLSPSYFSIVQVLKYVFSSFNFYVVDFNIEVNFTYYETQELRIRTFFVILPLDFYGISVIKQNKSTCVKYKCLKKKSIRIT